MRADRLAFQAQARATASSMAAQPIFKSEFIFYQLPDDGFHERSGEICLGRVNAVTPGGASHPKHVLDIARFEHTPQGAYPGFFGTFHKVRVQPPLHKHATASATVTTLPLPLMCITTYFAHH